MRRNRRQLLRAGLAASGGAVADYAIVYSGTPENVGPGVKGDVIECHIDVLPNLGVKVV